MIWLLNILFLILGIYPAAFFLVKKEIGESDTDTYLRRVRGFVVGGRRELRIRKRRIAVSLAFVSLIGLAVINISTVVEKNGRERVRITYSERRSDGKDTIIARVEIEGVTSDLSSATLDSLMRSQLRATDISERWITGELPIFITPTPIRGERDQLTVHNLPHDAVFEVFTKNGLKIAQFGELSGNFVWNLRDSSGHRLSEGVYDWYVRLGTKSVSGKMIVMR